MCVARRPPPPTAPIPPPPPTTQGEKRDGQRAAARPKQKVRSLRAVKKKGAGVDVNTSDSNKQTSPTLGVK